MLIPPSGLTNGCVVNSPAYLSLLSLSLLRCNNENEWYQVHENIIRKSNTKYSAPSTNYGNYDPSAPSHCCCFFVPFSLFGSYL